uniref:Uncharacterized protein n=1 Tax=Arundo donax TaxID=35708 RepID=A0A0A9DAC2_ARUDO
MFSQRSNAFSRYPPLQRPSTTMEYMARSTENPLFLASFKKLHASRTSPCFFRA